jgi:hypothetical protein
MTKNISKVTAQFVVPFALALLTLAAIPMYANAASYAYIDASGNIKSVTADNWMAAIATAPNISRTSGVLLLTGPAGFHIAGGKIVYGNR